MAESSRTSQSTKSDSQEHSALTVETEVRTHILKLTDCMWLGGVIGVLGTVFVSGVVLLFERPEVLVTVAAVGVIGVGIGGLAWWRWRP